MTEHTPERRAAPRPMVVAHRGASGYRPEHTEAAYRLALTLGAEAIEPDIVVTRDGELVLRHENEISGTTDVADRPEFASRRTTREIDGQRLTGWFTEDFTWAELSTLRARERLPQVRGASARFDGRYPVLRLRDLLRLLDEAAPAPGTGQPVRLVAEVKHASYFASIGLPLDELIAADLRPWAAEQSGRLIVEAFEQTVLGQLRDRGLAADYVYLLEKAGSPADLVARYGAAALSYAGHLTDAGLARLRASGIDGISVDTALLVRAAPRDTGQAGSAWRPLGGGLAASDLVDRAHAAGLGVFTWTLRPENRFLPAPCRLGTTPSAHGDWLTFFTAIMRTGLDGVFADQPDLAFEARAAL
ncbi:glycerophosphodiester phosphodiesterase family protein [Microcella sp.]|uniref:glycerophosphodiester phosphodiesterase family protein n=1 Tax=Microcella sp. TaxID=1913979 RepID=UPI003F72F874